MLAQLLNKTSSLVNEKDERSGRFHQTFLQVSQTYILYNLPYLVPYALNEDDETLDQHFALLSHARYGLVVAIFSSGGIFWENTMDLDIRGLNAFELLKRLAFVVQPRLLAFLQQTALPLPSNPFEIF